MTLILEDAEDSYHKPVILHCALCVLLTRFQLFLFSNCITITIITLITIINIIIIITIITVINIITIITHITIIYTYYYIHVRIKLNNC